MSIGGPPKAVLGGPQRRVSPNPVAATAAATTSKKKVAVNLPKESEPASEEADQKEANAGGTEDAANKKPRVFKDWARIPIPVAEGEARLNSYRPLPSEDLISKEPFLSDEWRLSLPPSIDVFLPGKVCQGLIYTSPPLTRFEHRQHGTL